MTRLSNRQYPMLKIFAIQVNTFHMTVEEAMAYDQRPFRSMLIQKWITFDPGRGFRITKEGRDAWEEFRSTPIARLDPSKPLTAYFDAAAYGLHRRRKKAA